MCHHRRRRRPSFLPAEAAARPGTGTVCVRESVVPYLTGNTTTLCSTPYLTHLHIHCLSSSAASRTHARQHARLFLLHRGPALFLCIFYTLTQPRLPDPADSAYFHCASIAVRLSRCNSHGIHFPLYTHMLSPKSPPKQQAECTWPGLLPIHLSLSPFFPPSKHPASLTPTTRH